ncbi:MAG: hypothetical protein GC187_11765 [Alphaproteobacteria bacterium]|nr:hypothetical protein [Alphaproteobacteria bacterium]
MKIKLLTMIAAFAITAGAASAADAASINPDAPPAAERPDRPWGPGPLALAAGDPQADVSRADFIEFLGAEFTFRDRNNDGVLTIEDASPADRARLERMRNSPRAQAWREQQGEDTAPRDMTRDAFIERGLSMFDRADANSDGVVTAEERAAAQEQMREHMREHRGDGEGRGRGYRRGG